MNYYRRYVGDYLRDTTRLSMLEHGAYTMLLDTYYAEEQPIADREEAYTIAKAASAEQKRAVDKILERYFDQRADGFHSKRADEEIAAAQQARENGKGGGRPRTGKETEHETGTLTGNWGGSGHPPTTNLQPFSLQSPASSEATAPSGGALDAGDPVVEKIPLCDGTECEVRKSFVSELERLYPAVDGPQTLREIRGWCIGNPRKTKTRRGVKAFLTSWFGREQNSASRRGV